MCNLMMNLVLYINGTEDDKDKPNSFYPQDSETF